MNMNAEYNHFREGLEELLFVNPTLGSLARALGAPTWNAPGVDTAAITYDEQAGKVVFSFQSDFIMTLSIEEVAGVIAHEAYHLILHHLSEVSDHATYPDNGALVKAHECIINDTIVTVHELPLPSFVMRGIPLIGEDLTGFSTKAAYDLFVDPNAKPASDEAGDCKESSEGGSGQAGSTPGSDKSEKSDEQGGSAGADSEDSTDGDENGSADGGSGDEDGEDSASGQSFGHGCGGIIVPDGYEAMAEKAFADAIGEAAVDKGVSVDKFMEQFNNTGTPSFSPTGADSESLAALSSARMNWKNLLAEINPKVMESGRKRRRSRDSWTTYNRRMGSIYPKVILPKSVPVEPKKADDDGDSLPVFVVALDLSGSIPRSLVKTLQGLLEDIPEALIKAYPCTWSNTCMPFVNGRVVGGGGTNINSVVQYVDQIKRETGQDPYVLCITDGEYSKPNRLPGKKWYYMAVDQRSVGTIRGRGSYGWYGNYGALVEKDEKVYCVDDFKDASHR